MSRDARRTQPRRGNTANGLQAAGLLTSVALVASLPAAGSVNASHAPWPWRDPAGLGVLSGEVLVLRAPGPEMLRVPAGTFPMGSTEIDMIEALSQCTQAAGRPLRPDEPAFPECQQATFKSELYRHPVELASFFLDRTEVKASDYQRCVELGQCGPLPSGGTSRLLAGDIPVSLVTHADAEGYCRWRRARLPTEAEWERAARGRTGRRYPWGNRYNGRLANHGRLGVERSDPQDGFAEAAPVGSYPDGRTPEGFLDLAGNVAEWVSDWYAPGYPRSKLVNPQGPPSPLVSGGVSARGVRGGDWRSAAPTLRGAARRGVDANMRAPTIGFRCARSDPPRGG